MIYNLPGFAVETEPGRWEQQGVKCTQQRPM